MFQFPDPQDVARAMELLEHEPPRTARVILKVTTRQARTLCFMRGRDINEARREPVFHRGLWVKVID